MSLSNTDHFDAAFVSQLTEHQLAIHLYVRSLMPGDPNVRDVSQQTNAKLWEKRHDFELGTHFKAWAFSVARFEVLNYRKAQARDARLVFSGELESRIHSELSAADLDLQARQSALRECMSKLRTEDRELLLYRYSNEGTLAEFADLAGKSLGGLKVTLHRLRTALLNCMRKQLQHEVST